MENLSLLTDFYQLTMLAGYHQSGKDNQRACFELYFRRNPHDGGFCIAAGLEPAVEYLTNLRFEPDQIDYLRSLGQFREEFLEWLKDFRFRGSVMAVPEGSLVFPGEPLLRVEATIPEAQLVESALLNIVNFQTLIATKAARMYVASKGGSVLEFGLRRAQGIDGALSASRASFLGGCTATSNTLAGKVYGIPVKGTHAHSWIMSFPTELEAFRTYAECYPDSCTLLVDTYDTLESGMPNAIIVAKELEAKGHRFDGVRLDSGDLAYLSKESRRMLDEAGLHHARIVASNDLDEYLIANLISQGAKIDIWGVGTHLVTSKGQSALGGVYKLTAAEVDGVMEPRIKVSSNPEKTTVPGVKQVWRALAEDGQVVGDMLTLEDETVSDGERVKTYHPLYANMNRKIRGATWQPLLEQVLRDGKVVYDFPPLTELRGRTVESLGLLRDEYKRRVNPHLYWMGLSPKLFELRNRMLDQNGQGEV
ncbi:MAG: nicotinate phosphoribosyltransferase [Candidatus Eremiobacteraeota bacterium]|nr:nicotinate phosphoribosyltransferase [Candidatus Eremiobacteraeota bacterium]